MQPGRNVKLLSGSWVEAQDLAAKDNLWFKILVLGDTDVQIKEVQDGWFFVESVLYQLRYKCWPTALKG